MSAPQFDIQEELKKLPHQPGVYIMRDADETILYVGKAIDLHNRVRSYFRKITGRGIQIDRMVEKIARFEYIVTDSELEALVLENNLIKENRPRYNTLLKDDKTYPYIKVTVNEPFPRIVFSRLLKKDKSRYFGPFTSATAVRDTIELINKLYGLRTCNRVLPRDCGKERPCLNYHMKTCMGPCTGNVSQEEYGARIEKALDFLNGNYADVLNDLKQKMLNASEEMNFEAAASYRNLIEAVEQVSQKQKMTDVNLDDRDIIAIAVEGISGEVLTDAQGESTGTDTGRDAVVQVFFVRDGRLIGREHFYVKVRSAETSEEKIAADVLNNFVKQFYAGTPFLPHEILLPYRIEDAEVIEKWLTERRGNRVYLTVPERGQKNKLMQLAAENAALILNKDKERLKREEGRT
ncbi:MAG: excinuclease ABC subunit C, partial [Lachnospiraceae bacterium]|nr:excinuclease ABC subunit C [Lachnospiraceae bacterium]